MSVRDDGYAVTGRFKKGYSLVVRDGIDCDVLLPAIADADFAGIEPTFIAGALPDPGSPVKTARELQRRCDDLGLLVPSMRGGRVPWDTISSADPAERTRAIDHVKRAFDALDEMGGTVLLIVPGRRDPTVTFQDNWKRVVEFGHQVGMVAKTRNKRVGFENVEARFPCSERDWLDLLDEIHHDNIGMYFDVGNVVWLGFGFPEQWIHTLRSRIVQVHFKDAVCRTVGATVHAEVRSLLEGEVNWPAVMQALHETEYTGWISVEPDPYTHALHRLPKRLSADLNAIFALTTEGTTP